MALLASPQLWAWIAIAAAVGYLLWLLSPILAPFLFAGILAYIFNPLVERLTRLRVPRAAAVVLVLLLALGIVAGLLLIVAPLFYNETRLLGERLPGLFAWFNERAAPWLKQHLDVCSTNHRKYVVGSDIDDGHSHARCLGQQHRRLPEAARGRHRAVAAVSDLVRG